MEQVTKLMNKGNAVKVSTFNIAGDQVKFLGNVNGSMDVKFNRVARIGSRYEEIVEDMEKIVSKEGNRVPVSKQYTGAVALLVVMSTGIRIGNEDSAEGYVSDLKYSDNYGKEVNTYGLATLRQEHVHVRNGIVHFDFVGKKQVDNSFKLNPALSKLVLPIIQSKYEPVFNLSEPEFTRFIKNETSTYFSSKDFRTFRANVYAYNKAKTMAKPTTKKEWKETVRAVCEYVSQYLNNTHQVVKTSYVDPMLWDYMFGPIGQFDKDKTKKEFGGLLLI